MIQMANPPTFPSDGRITTLQNYTAAFTGGELFPIVAPGNATAGINYNVTASTVAQNVLALTGGTAFSVLTGNGVGITPTYTTSPTIGVSVSVPNVYGGTASNSVLQLFGTNNVAPSNDGIVASAEFFIVRPIWSFNPRNETYFGPGTGPNGEGGNITMQRQNGSAGTPTAITAGNELGFIQAYGWDGTQLAPTNVPPAIVFVASENWNGTSHGTVLSIQAVPNGTSQAVNEFAVGNGITALIATDSGATQGFGSGTFNARNPNGYYIVGIKILSASGTTTLLAGPVSLAGSLSETGNLTLLSATALNTVATAAVLMSTVATFGIFCGTGVPAIAAGTGSLYLRNDGATATTRMYVNQNGNTTWTAVTTQA